MKRIKPDIGRADFAGARRPKRRGPLDANRAFEITQTPSKEECADEEKASR